MSDIVGMYVDLPEGTIRLVALPVPVREAASGVPQGWEGFFGSLYHERGMETPKL